MSGDLFDDLEEVAEQTSFSFNAGTRKARRGSRLWGHLSISPAMARAKVARPAPESPATAGPVQGLLAKPDVGIPRSVVDPPEPDPAPTVPRVITTRDELLDLIKRRRDELCLSHETIDALTGWASGLTSKYLCSPPIRGFAGQSLELILGALALGIAEVRFVEDPDAVKRMSGRWKPRKRNPTRTAE